MNVEIAAVEIKNSEQPLMNFDPQQDGPLTISELRAILSERGILRE
jgi:hypothetical protein